MALLAPLGITCEAAGADAITAVAPTFRPDIEREIDLIEEVARRLGADARGLRGLPAQLTHRRRGEGDTAEHGKAIFGGA